MRFLSRGNLEEDAGCHLMAATTLQNTPDSMVVDMPAGEPLGLEDREAHAAELIEAPAADLLVLLRGG